MIDADIAAVVTAMLREQEQVLWAKATAEYRREEDIRKSGIVSGKTIFAIILLLFLSPMIFYAVLRPEFIFDMFKGALVVLFFIFYFIYSMVIDGDFSSPLFTGGYVLTNQRIIELDQDLKYKRCRAMTSSMRAQFNDMSHTEAQDRMKKILNA